MKISTLSLVCAVAGALALVPPALAQTPPQTPAQTRLAPEQERISDSVIFQDYQSFTRLQNRIQELNAHGVPIRNYHLSKAQCWLDVSLHEYSRNDRSDFPQEAMSESERLIAALETGAEPLPMETPLVNGAARLRQDLWERTAALKQSAGFSCAAQQVACAEVELVHAGNEFNQQQWRHAKPYVQIAEELVAQAAEAADHCPTAAAAPAPVPVVAAPPAPEVCAPAAPQLTLAAEVLFDFDQYSPAHIRSSSLAELDALVARYQREHLVIGTLRLIGFADRLNATGQRDYNQVLSQKRVTTVRDLLAARGLSVSDTSIDARGDAEQVAACQARFADAHALQECLLPNRRVEVLLTGVRAAP